jgi:general secretion pathway protein G
MISHDRRTGDPGARRSRQRGFTLLELMAVLAILALIAGIVWQAVIPKVDAAKIDTAKTQMEVIGLALDNFRLDVGKYPDSLRGLIESSETGWRGPYLKKREIPQDPWKTDYVYEVVDGGNDYKLSSTGGGKEAITSR